MILAKDAHCFLMNPRQAMTQPPFIHLSIHLSNYLLSPADHAKNILCHINKWEQKFGVVGWWGETG